MPSVLVYAPIALLLVVIVGIILRAVKATNATIAESGLEPDASRGALQRVVDQIRSRDVRCPRCGQQAFARLGEDRRWMCEVDACRFEFEGPEHLPSRGA